MCNCVGVMFFGILASQGRHAHPILGRLFAQASATVVQLGISGVGAAAYADAEKEVLGSI